VTATGDVDEGAMDSGTGCVISGSWGVGPGDGCADGLRVGD